MQTYSTLRTFASALNEDNDCSVIAVAIVSGLDYVTAHKALANHGRRPRKGALTSTIHSALRANGFTMREANEVGEHITYEQARALRGKRTVRSVGRTLRLCAPGRKFLIYVRGHVAAFDGEQVQDWTKDRAHRVQNIVEVVRVGAPAPVAPVVPVTPKPVAPKPAPRHNPAQWQRHNVVVNGVTHRSLKAAFLALGLSLTGHQSLRLVLKASGRLRHAGYLFELAPNF